MLNPDVAVWVMFAASVVIGYISMPLMLGYTSPYIRFHGNKVVAALLMGCLMAMVEVGMHSSMMSSNKIILYLAVFGICSLVLIWMLQTQWFITIDGFLDGMIEHHAMALVMVKPFLEGKFTKDKNQDARINSVLNLAEDIYETQIKEIRIMDKLLG
jgi:hypothetical protein